MLVGFMVANRSKAASHARMLELALAETNDLFITTSPAKSTPSPSTNATVSPLVWVGPTMIRRTRTPPRSSTCSLSKVMSAARRVAPASSSPVNGERPANACTWRMPPSSKSASCCFALTYLADGGNAV